MFMGSPADMTERHARLLGRLAELGMALAEDLQARALAAETAGEAATLADAFHKLSRSVRQSLALEARLSREAVRAAREADERVQAEAAKPLVRRRAEAKARLARLVWTEAEDEAAFRYWDDGIERLLAAAEFDPGFAEQPIEEIVERLAETLKANAPPGPPGKSQRPDIVGIEWRIIDDAEPPDTG